MRGEERVIVKERESERGCVRENMMSERKNDGAIDWSRVIRQI